MKKNVASQKIGAQMIASADGTAFTGSVTVSVTGDAGTQATGSVGSGACTHEGNGYHTYAPAQAETNYDLIAFTFTGTGAIPATVQIFTSFPQTVDNATNISAIKTKTDFLPSATAGAAGGVFIAGSNAATTVNFTGNLSGSVGSVTGLTASNLDVAVSTRMATYTQPTGFLATSFHATGVASAAAMTSALGILVKVDTTIEETSLGSGIYRLTTANFDNAVVELKSIYDAAKTAAQPGDAMTVAGLTFTVPNVLDVNTLRVNGVEIKGDGAGTPFHV